MSIVVHRFDEPERFVAGTVGEPGAAHVLPAGARRRPGDQRRAGEAAGLDPRRADRRAARRGAAAQRWRRRRSRPSRRRLATRDPLDQPIVEEFRVGTITLELGRRRRAGRDRGVPGRRRGGRRWSRRRRRADEPSSRSRSRSRPTRSSSSSCDAGYARAFVQRAQSVVSAGRPPAVLRQPARPRGAPVPARQRLQARCRLTTCRRSGDARASSADPDARRLERRGPAGRPRRTPRSSAWSTLDGVDAALRLQAGAGRAAAVGLPRRHAGRPRGRGYGWSRTPAGWDVVPPTVLRDGPFGAGMCQHWIDSDGDDDPVDVVPPGQTTRRLDRRARGRGPAGPAGARSCIADDAAAARHGGVRRRRQQRRPQGRARAGRGDGGCGAATTASRSTSRTSCAPSSGAGPTSRCATSTASGSTHLGRLARRARRGPLSRT